MLCGLLDPHGGIRGGFLLDGQPLCGEKSAGTNRGASPRCNRRRTGCDLSVSRAGLADAPLVLYMVRAGVGTSLGWKRKPSRGCPGDADCDSRGNVVRRRNRDGRYGRGAGHRTHPHGDDAGHCVPYGHPTCVACRAGVAFFADRVAGLPGDFVCVDEIQDVAEIADLESLRFAALASSRWHTSKTRRSEEHTSELQSRLHLVCRLLLEKKKNIHFL